MLSRSSFSLRNVALGRRLCTSAPAALHEQVKKTFDHLLDSDWVDAAEPVELIVESAEKLIDDYRQLYNPDAPHDDLYNDVAALYAAKEAATITDAFGDMAEDIMRRHERMVGFLGSTLTRPPVI